MNEFIKLIFKRPWSAAVGFGAGLLSSVSSVALMGTASWFIAAMAQAGAAGILLNILIPSALIRLLAVSRTLLRYLDRLTLHDATFRIIGDLRLSLFDTTLALPWSVSSTMRDSALERTLKNDTALLENAYLKELAPLALAFSCGAIFGCVAAFFSLRLTLVLIALALCSCVVIPCLLSVSVRHLEHKAAPSRLKIFSVSHDLCCGLLDLCALGEQDSFYQKIRAHSEVISSVKIRSEFMEGIALSLIKTSSMGAMILSVFLLSPLVIRGQVSGPVMIMLSISSMALYEALIPLSTVFFDFGKVRMAATEIFRLKHRGQELSDHASPRIDIRSAREIAFLDVSVSYKGYDVFNHLSLTFKDNENTLVKGAVGSGKSTIFLLMQKLIFPSGGVILADTIPYEALNSSSLRCLMPMALQDPQLFSGTLRNVFTMVRPEISDARIKELLSVVELDGFLASLPHGLDEYLGITGMALSGGEARRLCIARALCAGGNFLILDEPGEGLEPSQERRILSRILSSRRGVIISTHRSLSVKGFDQIVKVSGKKAVKIPISNSQDLLSEPDDLNALSDLSVNSLQEQPSCGIKHNHNSQEGGNNAKLS